MHWVKRCILPIFHCSLSSNRFDCVCSKLKMSSESYCCYLVCCSFDSLLEQPVSCSLLEQSSQLKLLDKSASQLKLPVKPVQSVVCGESLTCYDVVPQKFIVPRHVFNKDCATHKPRLCGIGGSYTLYIVELPSVFGFRTEIGKSACWSVLA